MVIDRRWDGEVAPAALLMVITRSPLGFRGSGIVDGRHRSALQRRCISVMACMRIPPRQAQTVESSYSFTSIFDCGFQADVIVD